MHEMLTAAFGDIKTIILDALPTVALIAMPIFGLLVVIALVVRHFSEMAGLASEKRDYMNKLDHDFDGVARKIREEEYLFEWLEIDDDDDF